MFDAAMTALDTDDTRWAAVRAKQREADGEFVFAVKTTGIYCRPSCPSRPAKREHVTFFDTTHDARAAGYRACKRCTPDDVGLEHVHREAVQRACEALARSDAPITLADLAAESGWSAYHFHRLFKSVTGLTPKAYWRSVRTARMNAALQTAPNVTHALHDAGFSSSGRFYEHARERLGMDARAAQRGGAGETLRYAVAPCTLGWVLVAATSRGVCAIELGDSADALVDALRARFPKASIVPADAAFDGWVARVVRVIEEPRGALDLPLDVRGTAFQQRVWQALSDIPPGSTTSYREIAARIGQPQAVRAVASAIASNALAVAIPCHRVVRSDGALSGYRWGVDRKRTLLAREHAAPETTHDSAHDAAHDAAHDSAHDAARDAEHDA